MHHEPEEITCPNCGTHAAGNYCYECGQDNHLHKDTLGGLIMHFFEHYFHYDNKFWQTIKTLILKPGELTLAYWKQQRMRYISPISLYIFISAVYFSLSFLALSYYEKEMFKYSTNPITKKTVLVANINPSASFKISKTENGAADLNKNSAHITDTVTKPKPDYKMSRGEKVLSKFEKDPKLISTIVEKTYHNFPKFYFFIIPFIALLLKLLFLKRADLYFVDHLIFTLHFHSVYFLLSTIGVLISFLPWQMITSLVTLATYIFTIRYLIKALKVVYHISTARALSYTFIIGFIYMLIFCALLITYGFFLLQNL